MSDDYKGLSPFHPGQPVPTELFTGRGPELERIVERGIEQTARGKPTAFFVQGEYGIGKSSTALYAQRVAATRHKMVGLYAPLGGAKSLEDVAARVLEATFSSGVYEAGDWGETVRDWLAKIGKKSLYGVEIDFEKLKRESPKLASPAAVLGFLDEVQQRNEKVRGGKGIFLIFDEINGIAAQPEFAHFLKTLVDSNAARTPRVPLVLVLCGVQERRADLIRCHPPTDRLFDVIDILPMSESEQRDFFVTAFRTANIEIDADALDLLTRAAAGFPKIMQTVGDCCYYQAGIGRLSREQAVRGVHDASQEVGRKFVDHQVYDAIQSDDYRSILTKIARHLGALGGSFTKKELDALLTASERKKLGNFLQKLKKLNVLKSAETRGEYEFRIRMVQTYVWLRSFKA